MEKAKKSLNINLSKFFVKNNTYLMFVLLFIVCILVSGDFLKVSNLINIGRQYTVLVFVSMGMLFVILTGGIDLSVGSMIAFGSVMTGVCMTYWGFGVIQTFVAIAAMGLMIGAVSGVLVAYLQFAPFIATLSMMITVRGITFMISDGPIKTPANSIGALGTANIFGFFPALIFLAILLLVVFWFIQKYTSYGRLVMAIGSNETAVKLAGIRVNIYKASTYALSGGLCAIAGVLTASRSAIGSPLVGTGVEMDAIAACVIGGASLSGGEGSATKTVIGVLILALIGNIMNLLAIPSYPQDVIKGLIIVAAVLMQAVTTKQNKTV